MKYFTREYWFSLQSRDYTPPPEAESPFRLYHAELALLRERLAPEVFGFFSEADVHDGELLEFTVVDGNAGPHRSESPHGNGRASLGFPVRVHLRVMDAHERLVWTLNYSAVRRCVVQYNAEADLFPSGSGGGFGFGDWGYHELRDVGAGFLAHEVLFATGSALLVEFQQVEVRSGDARAAADQRGEPDEGR